jgi:hypothetical protein
MFMLGKIQGQTQLLFMFYLFEKLLAYFVYYGDVQHADRQINDSLLAIPLLVAAIYMRCSLKSSSTAALVNY